MIYILAWLSVDQLSHTDNEGYSAMHLAVKTADRLENSRIVRILLYHGARTDLKDLNGNTAIDIANDLEESRTKQDILRLLNHKAGLIELLQYRTPLRKVNKSMKMPMAYLLFNLYVYIITLFFNAPLWQDMTEIYFVLTTFMLATIFWIISMQKDPGYIQPYPKVDFLEILQLIDPIQLCPDCLVVRTPRSKHCAVCNRCVERFDHHCPWLNNCVGVSNHVHFIIFLTLLVTNIISMFVLTTKNYALFFHSNYISTLEAE